MCNPIPFKSPQNKLSSLDEEAQAPAKERVRILSEDELSLNMVEMQEDVRERITKALTSKYDNSEIVTHGGALKIKNKNQSVKHFVEHWLYLEVERKPISGEFKTDITESNLPQHHCIGLLETEQFVEPVLCKSMRIDENIINGRLCHKIPKLDVIVCDKESSDTKFCLHAPMCGIGLASFRQDQPSIKYLATAGLKDCHAIIFWDGFNQVASMSHFDQADMCQEAFDLMLESMSYHQSSDLRMFVIGGYTHKMTRFPSFFNFIEDYAKSKKISVDQTFLGNHGGRPSDVIFDVETGTLFELVVKENLTRHKLGLFDANKYEHGKIISFRGSSDHEVKYRFADAKNSDLLIPILAEASFKHLD